MPTFSEAFAAARKAGKKTFEWNGKLYGAKLKGETDTGGGRQIQENSQET